MDGELCLGPMEKVETQLIHKFGQFSLAKKPNKASNSARFLNEVACEPLCVMFDQLIWLDKGKNNKKYFYQYICMIIICLNKLFIQLVKSNLSTN